MHTIRVQMFACTGIPAGIHMVIQHWTGPPRPRDGYLSKSMCFISVFISGSDGPTCYCITAAWRSSTSPHMYILPYRRRRLAEAYTSAAEPPRPQSLSGMSIVSIYSGIFFLGLPLFSDYMQGTLMAFNLDKCNTCTHLQHVCMHSTRTSTT